MHLGDPLLRQRPHLPLHVQHKAVIGLERFTQALQALLNSREHNLACRRVESLYGLTAVQEVLVDLLHPALLVMSNAPFWLARQC